jgi:hypothetical protein
MCFVCCIGEFTYVVGTAGVYHYWSGWIDGSMSHSMRGVITVTARESTVQAVTVSLAGHQALYETASGEWLFICGTHWKISLQFNSLIVNPFYLLNATHVSRS